MEAPHFKMEGIQTLKSLLKQEDWLVKVDLKDAYFSIPISRERRKYLCFAIGNSTYQFNCLPFSLASAGSSSQTRAGDAVDCVHRLYSLVGVRREGTRSGLRPGLPTTCVGFTINTDKSTLTIELSLPTEKFKKFGWSPRNC